jgi:hypothetical protein
MRGVIKEIDLFEIDLKKRWVDLNHFWELGYFEDFFFFFSQNEDSKICQSKKTKKNPKLHKLGPSGPSMNYLMLIYPLLCDHIF